MPFLPTIGLEALILSTMATPVPSHDITRELFHLSKKPSLCHSIPVRFIRCFLNIKLVFGPFRSCSLHFLLVRASPSELELSSGVSPLVVFFPYRPCVYILPSFFWKVSDLSCSFCLKEARVCRSLRYFGLTTLVSIHGGGWLFNHQSFPSLNDSFL